HSHIISKCNTMRYWFFFMGTTFYTRNHIYTKDNTFKRGTSCLLCWSHDDN
ncbi:hypothetical protein ACJX0J_022463, partial [Zea mays]